VCLLQLRLSRKYYLQLRLSLDNPMRMFIRSAFQHVVRPLGALPAALIAGIGGSAALFAQDLTGPEQPRLTLDTVTVEAEGDSTVQAPFLPPVAGTMIYSGKKTSVIDLDSLPPITNNNYRQALAKTPGLYLSEESTPLVSIGYRGLNPDRVQFTQVLRDGIPIHADQFGYPEAYFTPPLDTVDRIEFLRGGASLLYGPQPGGALNYVTHRPQTSKPFGFGSNQTFGSNQYYSTFNYVDGTSGRLGYYGYYNHRQSDGFRERNSDFRLDSGLVKLVLDAETDSRWILTIDAYRETHGEPGGLTLQKMRSNPRETTRPYDRFELQRYSASLQWERDFSDDTKMVTSLWASSYSRWSKRQKTSGNPFGFLPSGPDSAKNQIQDQKFYTFGLDQRWLHHYAWLGGDHSLSAGIQVYRSISPRKDFDGTTPDANTGALARDTDRTITYLPVFLENKFSWGPFSLTPGVRFENLEQSVRENINKAKATTDASSERTFVPLFGLGMAYEFAPKVELYANVSQSYRPKMFTQAVPTGPNQTVPADLSEASAWQYEVGFKGRPKPWAYWDTSVFVLDFDNQIGQERTNGIDVVRNMGRARHMGLELAGEIDLLGLIERESREPSVSGAKKDRSGPCPEFGSLSLYGNATLMNAEYLSGLYPDNTPAYAARYMVRAGLVYRSCEERLRVALTSSFIGKSFANDNNTPNYRVPSYAVWDLTGEAKVYKDSISLTWGVNNLFDKNYFSRITATGIDPGQGRNFYGGLSLKF
jgi:Fe(3+) dicitrate transport protein